MSTPLGRLTATQERDMGGAPHRGVRHAHVRPLPVGHGNAAGSTHRQRTVHLDEPGARYSTSATYQSWDRWRKIMSTRSVTATGSCTSSTRATWVCRATRDSVGETHSDTGTRHRAARDRGGTGDPSVDTWHPPTRVMLMDPNGVGMRPHQRDIGGQNDRESSFICSVTASTSRVQRLVAVDQRQGTRPSAQPAGSE